MTGLPSEVEVWLEGTTRRVVVSGRLDLDSFTDAVGKAVEAEFDTVSDSMLVDFTPVGTVDLADIDLSKVVASIRRRLGRSGDYRFAVVAPSATLTQLVDDTVRVRDMMAGGSADVVAVRPFADIEDARAWLAESDE